MNRLGVGAIEVSLGLPSMRRSPRIKPAGQTFRRGSRSYCLRPASKRSRATRADRALSTCRRFPHRCPRSPSIPVDSWRLHTAATGSRGLPTKPGLLASDHASVGLPFRTCRANRHWRHSIVRCARARSRHFSGRGSSGAATTTLRTGRFTAPTPGPTYRLFRAARSASTSTTRNNSRHFSRNSSTTTTTPPTVSTWSTRLATTTHRQLEPGDSMLRSITGSASARCAAATSHPKWPNWYHLQLRFAAGRQRQRAVSDLQQPQHAAPSIAAAEAGKHVFVEKPLCTTVREAEAMVAAADRAGTLSMVVYMKRHEPVALCREPVAGA
jgi:Oxidoreductase family, NAD-binding Rossmann fold